MKKILSVMLAAALCLACAAPALASAGKPAPYDKPKDSYAGKTVVLYTGNVRGDVDVYPRIAALKKQYADKGADVLLADAGNYLQGSAAANGDRGLTIYNMMDAAGYDAAGMGLCEFGWTEATTGYPYHGNVTRYYTQGMLQDGTEEITYNQNKDGSKTGTLAAKEPAKFKAVCSNAALRDCYSFANKVDLTTKGGLTVRFLGIADAGIAELVQDGYFVPGEPVNTLDNFADVTVTLSNSEAMPEGERTILAPASAGFVCGALVIDNETLTVSRESFDLSGVSPDPAVAALAEAAKAKAPKVIGTSEVTLEGRDSQNRNRETNLGDFTCDAIKWYAETYMMDELDPEKPVVVLQNGGNCDQFLYAGEITETDLLWALPFSPMGIGAVEVTGAELLEILEAAAQCENSPGFAQAAGLEYTVYSGVEYDGGAAYGNFFVCDSMERVRIDSVGGERFRPNARYTLVCDNYLMSGNDTYYKLKEIKETAGESYLNNGGGVKVRDIAAMYIKEVLGGVIGQEYAAPEGRITVTEELPPAARWAAEKGVAGERFSFQGDCTRAEAVAMLWQAAGSPVVNYLMTFEDVAGADPFAEAVRWAASEGLVSGTGGGEFQPDRAITREEAVTLAYRWVQKQGGGFTGSWMFLLSCADWADVSEWADEAAHWADMNGALTVKPGNRMDPQGTASQGAMAGLLYAAAALPPEG